jgi:tRNA1Val (adenine37-N6)-methyltransferase
MKIGTDAVLLGAWTSIVDGAGNPLRKVLDVGAGCGIIAMMMAQRTDAEVDAVEIEAESCNTCKTNFEQSTYWERLKLYQSGFSEFAIMTDGKYDLVCCNPPYFTDSLKNPNPQRAIARHDTMLNLNTLFTAAKTLLTQDGFISVIYPFPALKTVQQASETAGLFIQRIAHVLSAPAKTPVRVMVQIGSKFAGITEESIIIRNTDHTFTDEYQQLTKEFYLAF